MPRVLIFDEHQALADLLKTQLEACGAAETCLVDDSARIPSSLGAAGGRALAEKCSSAVVDTLVYSPRRLGRTAVTLDLEHARQALRHVAQSGLQHVVLISSAMVYHPRYSNPGRMTESRPTTDRQANLIASQWRAFELLAEETLAEGNAVLTILRPCPTLVPLGRDYLSRLFRGRWALRFVGHDPSLQLLCVEDLARAVVCAVSHAAAGVFNIAPDAVVPLRKALRAARVLSVPAPRFVQRPIRFLCQAFGVAPVDQADFIRYCFTVSNEKAKRTWGFQPTKTSLQTLADYLARPRDPLCFQPENGQPTFDDFGLDEEYLQWHSRRVLRFLERAYWRIEVTGMENIPVHGGAVLAGIHRGFMPFDGILLVHLLQRYAGRIPRFLIHPGLVKFPVLAEFLTKIGGVIACEDNADYLLNRGDLLGVFPEGIRGAFQMYRDAYRLDQFGRSDYVKFAIRRQVPIIPAVYLGPAESFPILARVDWPWWKRHTDWPFFPITPTWPCLPIPLPTKWHLRILEPVSLEPSTCAADADNPGIVEAIAERIREVIHSNLVEMRSRRKSIFWGSLRSE